MLEHLQYLAVMLGLPASATQLIYKAVSPRVKVTPVPFNISSADMATGLGLAVLSLLEESGNQIPHI